MRGLLLVISALVLNTCEEKMGETIHASPAAVSAVTTADTIRLGEPIAFEITCGTPTPCWKFKQCDITQAHFVYTIRAIAEYDGRPCIQVLGSFKTQSSIIPKERGTYVLRFWQTDSQFLERSVVVR